MTSILSSDMPRDFLSTRIDVTSHFVVSGFDVRYVGDVELRQRIRISGFPLDENGEATAQCLDGEWDFKLVPNPKSVPLGYESVGAQLDGFCKYRQNASTRLFDSLSPQIR